MGSLENAFLGGCRGIREKNNIAIGGIALKEGLGLADLRAEGEGGPRQKRGQCTLC